jgi:type II secretory ATPase GspE/PulE/Tfp pilus assembly ATPase PilB-like protein
MNITRNNTNEIGPSIQPIVGFIKHLNDNVFQEIVNSKISDEDRNVARSSIRSIWESCDLSAGEFADQVAAYYQRPRMTLGQLLATPALVERFSRRFLREAMIFPFDAGSGCFGLAVADPTDLAAQRGAEIVLGGPVAVSIASFEDIGAALFERLGSDEDGPSALSPVLASGAVEDSVDSLRDLASGAPVVRAVNDLVEKAIELRASDIHIEPMRRAASRGAAGACARRGGPTQAWRCGLLVGETVFESRGCERCAGVGYRGRVGVLEALEVDGEVRSCIGQQVDAIALDQAARRAGLTTMMEDAIAKCRDGVTTVAEALRVTTAR